MSNLNSNKLKNNHCKTELALLVGNDLPEAEAVTVKRHVAICPECRKHYLNLEQGMKPLREFAGQTAKVPQVDLWPDLEEQLKANAHSERRRHLVHTLAPAVSVLVACSLLFLVMGQTTDTAPNSNFTPGATSVSHPAVNMPAIRGVVQHPERSQEPTANDRERFHQQFRSNYGLQQ